MKKFFTLITCLLLLTNGVNQIIAGSGDTNPPPGANGNFAKSAAVAENPNVLLVAKFGSDETGSRGGSPFLTLAAAKAAAQGGDTITVYPGTYNENDLLKDSVNWNFMPGATVTYSNADNSSVIGIFDDRFTGAVTSTIAGQGRFILNAFTNNAVFGTVCQTNPDSRINFEADSVGFTLLTETAIYPSNAAIFVLNGMNSSFNVKRVYDPLDGQNVFVWYDEFDDPVFWAPEETGVYWSSGETHITAETIDHFQWFSVWAEHQAINTKPTDNLWLTANLIESMYFVSGANGTNLNWKTWATVKEMRGGLQIHAKGKQYVFAQKIGLPRFTSGILNCIDIGPKSGTNWITVQKISVGGVAGFVKCAGGITRINAMEFEDTGGALPITCTGGQLIINGGDVTALSAPGVLCSGGVLDLRGVTITTINTNPPVFKNGGTLKLSGVRLIGPTTTNSIAATNSQTVAAYGSAANRDKSANVTLSPNVGFTVDSNVQ